MTGAIEGRRDMTAPDPPIRPNQVLTGPLFNEPMWVDAVLPGGLESCSVGLVGTESERFRKVTLNKLDGPMPRGDQLTRQWRLLKLIDRPQGITIDDDARDLAVTIRTIWRDLLVLQDAGFPLTTDRGRTSAAGPKH
jgi:hypothetical protein